MTDKIELSLLARQDISDILTYTQLRYGDAQCDAYSEAIFHCIEALRVDPGLGHSRADIPPFYRAFGIKKHVVIYCRKEKTIFIARVLHGTMDFRTKL